MLIIVSPHEVEERFKTLFEAQNLWIVVDLAPNPLDTSKNVKTNDFMKNTHCCPIRQNLKKSFTREGIVLRQ